MYCLKNIHYNRIPNDVIMKYVKLYTFIGQNTAHQATLEDDYKTLILETAKTDAYFLAQYLGLNITDFRFKQLLLKDIKPKTHDETVLRNIKRAFMRVHTETDRFELFAREIQDLLKFLFKDTAHQQRLNFAKSSEKNKQSINLLSSGHKTKREALEALINTYHQEKKQPAYENGFINLNFYLDFMQLKPFNDHNDVVAFVLWHLLLIHDGYQAFHLSSFFEKLYKRRETFKRLSKDALHNYKEGMADTHDLHRFTLDIAIECYEDVAEIIRNYTFDQQMNKGDYIENTINRLDEVFTKEAIREAHPTISDSTINRTLKRMRDEKKIRPLGKGRSAKWMKLYPTKKKQSLNEQLNLKL